MKAPWVRGERRRPQRASLELTARVMDDIRQDAPGADAYFREQWPRLSFDVDYVTELTESGSSVLDVGCAPPVLPGSLLRLGYSVTGIDRTPEAYESTYRRLGLRVIRCDLDSDGFDLSDSSFDTVVFNEVFEHLRVDPISALAEIRRVLRPGGTALLSTPNLRSISGIRNFLFRSRAYAVLRGGFPAYESLERTGLAGHIREYTALEMREFLEGVGFEVVGLVYRGRYTRPLWNAFGRIFPRFRPFMMFVVAKA
ncbi:MAG: class I SAM-dependent methyltransferase [Planctomycetota bacterium]|jgi:SAM-dependent methyltransferase